LTGRVPCEDRPGVHGAPARSPCTARSRDGLPINGVETFSTPTRMRRAECAAHSPSANKRLICSNPAGTWNNSPHRCPKAADHRQHSAARCWTVRSGTDLMASMASRDTSQRRANCSQFEQKTARRNTLIKWLVGPPVIQKAYPRVDRSDDYENQSAVAQLEHDEETDEEKCDSAPGENQRLSSSHPPSMPRWRGGSSLTTASCSNRLPEPLRQRLPQSDAKGPP